MRYLILLSFTLFFNVSYSQIINNKPLEIGSEAPVFSGKNQSGKKVFSQELLKEGDIVVVFYRGEWCGYCKRHLSNLQDSLALISEKGAHVVVVTPEQPKYVKKTIKKTKATYSIISDKDFTIMNAFNVKYEVNDSTTTKFKGYVDNVTKKQNNSGESVLPIPATYIIGRDGTIKWFHFDPNYTKRSSVKDILTNL